MEQQIKIKAYQSASTHKANIFYVGLDDIDHVNHIEVPGFDTTKRRILQTVTLKGGITYYTDMHTVSRIKKAILNNKTEMANRNLIC
ncbi:MAG: hypothetical protein IKP66_08860 [Lachnospiraceae bacterium]|nr:hypothetical protein [Lachnospiraceae bacterium]